MTKLTAHPISGLAGCANERNARHASKAQVEAQVRQSLGELAAPIQNDALTAFTRCQQGAIQANWYNEWSTLCLARLEELDPASWPLLTEWTASPSAEAEVVVPVGVVSP